MESATTAAGTAATSVATAALRERGPRKRQ
jgi:hypothetical protein